MSPRTFSLTPETVEKLVSVMQGAVDSIFGDKSTASVHERENAEGVSTYKYSTRFKDIMASYNKFTGYFGDLKEAITGDRFSDNENLLEILSSLSEDEIESFVKNSAFDSVNKLFIGAKPTTPLEKALKLIDGFIAKSSPSNETMPQIATFDWPVRSFLSAVNFQTKEVNLEKFILSEFISMFLHGKNFMAFMHRNVSFNLYKSVMVELLPKFMNFRVFVIDRNNRVDEIPEDNEFVYTRDENNPPTEPITPPEV